ncbi:MAG: hypothetical protein BGN88_14945 [Clostridiales bacterium 43-6]|nr:MAG: hypothetical protein BGN88_14945 [Clostridiales bacterium 43-6]
MIPTIKTAEHLLQEAERMNPGPWANHSRVAGSCAKTIAEHCGLDPDKAYLSGLLHDIGRRCGVTDLRHVYDGYVFMREQGHPEIARICMTHSFPYQDIGAFNGNNDCTPEEAAVIVNYLNSIEYDDYDKLIQLCDALAFPDGATFVEKRLIDVALRRGVNTLTVPKWKIIMHTKAYFDSKTGCDIYNLLGVGI